MRCAELQRTSPEARVSISLNLDGGASRVSTGLAFFDHMLLQLAAHGHLGLEVNATSDLGMGEQHVVEAVGLCLGEAFRMALPARTGIRRLGEAHAVQDGSLARVVVDLGGRAWCHYGPRLPAVRLGNGFHADQTKGFMVAFCDRAGFGIHADLLRGTDLHHELEALFKALGLALRRALVVEDDLGLMGTTSH